MSEHSVPMKFIDLAQQQKLIRPQLDAAIKRVLDHGQYIMGPEVEEFENSLRQFTGVKHALTCANGTDALTIALLALNAKACDAIFVPSFTYIASAESIALVGATPYFIDVTSDYNICLRSLEVAINDALENDHNPRVVIPVDLFGRPSVSTELDHIAGKYNLKIIYDSAQSFGSSHNNKKIGNFGDITTTSFFPAKPLGCYGDGGAIFTNDEDLANLIRSIKNHGMGQHKYEHINIGVNSRLDTIQAAVLNQKINLLEGELQKRNEIANYYNEALKSTDLILPELSKDNSYAWAQYTVRHQNRDIIIKKLSSKGIPTAIYYPIPLNQQEAYKKCNVVSSGIPNTEKYCKEVFSLPMSPYLEKIDQDFIIRALTQL